MLIIEAFNKTTGQFIYEQKINSTRLKILLIFMHFIKNNRLNKPISIGRKEDRMIQKLGRIKLDKHHTYQVTHYKN